MSSTLKKLESMMEKWTHEVPPRGVSLSDIRLLEYICVALVRNGSAKFFASSLVPHLEKCGVQVDYPQGDEINYTAHLS